MPPLFFPSGYALGPPLGKVAPLGQGATKKIKKRFEIIDYQTTKKRGAKRDG